MKSAFVLQPHDVPDAAWELILSCIADADDVDATTKTKTKTKTRTKTNRTYSVLDAIPNLKKIEPNILCESAPRKEKHDIGSLAQASRALHEVVTRVRSSVKLLLSSDDCAAGPIGAAAGPIGAAAGPIGAAAGPIGTAGGPIGTAGGPIGTAGSIGRHLRSHVAERAELYSGDLDFEALLSRFLCEAGDAAARVESLFVRNWHGSIKVGTIHLAALGMRGLRTLEIGPDHNNKWTSFDDVNLALRCIAQCCPALASLKCTIPAFSRDCFQELRGLKQLRTLDMSEVRNGVFDEDFRYFTVVLRRRDLAALAAAAPGLHTLRLTFNGFHGTDLSVLSPLAELRHLELRSNVGRPGASGVTVTLDEDLLDQLAYLPQLAHLAVEDLDLTSTRALDLLDELVNFPQLADLAEVAMEYVSRKYSPPARRLLKLESLHVAASCCEAQALGVVATACPRLVRASWSSSASHNKRGSALVVHLDGARVAAELSALCALDSRGLLAAPGVGVGVRVDFRGPATLEQLAETVAANSDLSRTQGASTSRGAGRISLASVTRVEYTWKSYTSSERCSHEEAAMYVRWFNALLPNLRSVTCDPSLIEELPRHLQKRRRPSSPADT